MQKKRVVVFVGLFVLSLLLITLISETVAAQELDLAGIFEKIVGNEAGSDGGTISKFLVMFLFAMLFSAVLLSVELFKERKWMAWTISIIIVILGARFIPSRTVIGLFLPTAAFILAGSLVIQFALILFINQKIFRGTGVLNRMMWFVWSAALLILLVKFGIWAFLSSTSIKIGSFTLLERPSFVLDATSVFLYIIAIIAGTTAGPWLEKKLEKVINKEEYISSVTKLQRNVKLQKAKRDIEAGSMAEET